jgi:F-type H+-transporting ATPase subunit gamma
METLESLGEALETTDDIQSIVRTMKSLSAVSIHQFERAEEALTTFEDVIDQGLTALLHERRARGLPLPETMRGRSAREGLILVGSDRGLCGRYNDTAARFAADRIGGNTVTLAVIGARAAARIEALGRAPDRLFDLPGSVEGLSQTVQAVIVAVDTWTRDRDIGRVRLVHNRRKGQSMATPVERQLLPLPDAYLRRLAGAPWPGRGLPFFRMRPERLLSWLVQQRLYVVLYRALAEALASEHAMRLATMQNAESNIEERQEDLTAAYRQKRQETITRELLDVVAGFEAVGGRDA